MKTFTKLLALAGLTFIIMVSCNNISESQKADIVLENIFPANPCANSLRNLFLTNKWRHC